MDPGNRELAALTSTLERGLLNSAKTIIELRDKIKAAQLALDDYLANQDQQALDDLQTALADAREVQASYLE